MDEECQSYVWALFATEQAPVARPRMIRTNRGQSQRNEAFPYAELDSHQVCPAQKRQITGRLQSGWWLLKPRFRANNDSLGMHFSKKIENHIAMVAIHAVSYNFARIHKTLRITPAMAAGLSDHVWTLEEIVLLAQ